MFHHASSAASDLSSSTQARICAGESNDRWDVDVCASRQMCRLLKEDVIRAEDFAHIYGDFLGARVGVNSDRNTPLVLLTSFCAEKMEFMMGMYVED